MIESPRVGYKVYSIEGISGDRILICEFFVHMYGKEREPRAVLGENAG